MVVTVIVWWLQVSYVDGVTQKLGCYSYYVVVTSQLCGWCQDRNGGVTVIMWWLQVIYVGSARTEMGVLQLCGN